MKKTINLLFYLFIFVIFSCSQKNDLEEIYNFSLTKINEFKSPVGYIYKLYINKQRNFVTLNTLNYSVVLFNMSGNIKKEVGGRGMGPGEFQSLHAFSYSEDNFYICDYKNWRLSIFNDSLNFKNSFILKHNYEREVIKYKDKLLLFGDNYSNPWKKCEDYYIADIYKLDLNNKYNFEKSVIKIKNFPKFGGRVFAGFPNFSIIRDNDSLFIFYTFSQNIIKYNMNTNEIRTVAIEFPTYINPLNVKYKKWLREAEKKWGLKYINEYIFSFYPEYSWYDSNNERFIVQFGRPYQLIKNSDNKNRYIIVIFDKDFNFQGSIYTDKQLLLCHTEENKTKLFMTWLPDFYDPNYIEPEEYFIEEYELIEKEHEK